MSTDVHQVPAAAAGGAPAPGHTMAVAICAFTELRWEHLTEAVGVVSAQLGVRDRLILVIDHNPALADRAREAFAAAGPTVLENTHGPGLAGARNTAVEHAAEADVVVFLDDDALPRPGWLQALRARFDDPATVGVGGAVRARWVAGRPPWFPPELGWMVGCDYPGLAVDGGTIRNPIGANMALRRSALDAAGTFHPALGRVGTKPVGCEETELAIRIRQRLPHTRMVRDTTAVVDHLVPAERARVGYLWRRGYHEGRSKATLSALVGADAALSAEKGYLAAALRAAVAHAAGARHGDTAGLLRAGVLLLGVTGTGLGYLTGRLTTRPTGQRGGPTRTGDAGPVR